ncbi:MAG: agmatine deiminase family protein [Bacteroidetes bacterium]|nr:agmatine deiminase family protein [Bacteroidota bacterium]
METETILWLPDSLQQKKWQDFTHSLLDVLDPVGIPYGWIKGTQSIWARDYMPVEVREGVYVQFRYDPSYLNKYPQDRLDAIAGVDYLQALDPEAQIWVVPLKLDGGNVVMNQNLAIVSERVFTENAHVPGTRVAKILMEYLDREVVFIPVQSRDEIGHADGLVRFMDESKVLISDYNTADHSYREKLKSKLNRYGLKVHTLPYNPYDNHTWLDASGTYLNYLELPDAILFPEFGGHLSVCDAAARRELEDHFPHKRILAVPCTPLAKEGGILNCISWTRWFNPNTSVRPGPDSDTAKDQKGGTY